MVRVLLPGGDFLFLAPKGERGRYELVASVQGYIKYLKDRAIGGDIPADAIGDHKVRLLKARADIAEFESERLAESLIPADEVEKVWTAAVGLKLPGPRNVRVAPLARTTRVSLAWSVILALSGSDRPGG